MRPRKSPRLVKELKDDAHLIKAWRSWHREQRDAVLAGPHGPMAERLMVILNNLTLQSGRHLLAYVCGVDWATVDFETKLVIVHEINTSIAQMRERAGLDPLDDPLPGQPDNVFRVIKHILNPA